MPAHANPAARRLLTGTCFINSYNDAPVELPFGGVRMSGVGRENAAAAIAHIRS